MECRNLILKLRRGAMNVWQNTQQMRGAMMHILDNDTSAKSRRKRAGASPMWVV